MLAAGLPSPQAPTRGRGGICCHLICISTIHAFETKEIPALSPSLAIISMSSRRPPRRTAAQGVQDATDAVRGPSKTPPRSKPSEAEVIGQTIAHSLQTALMQQAEMLQKSSMQQTQVIQQQLSALTATLTARNEDKRDDDKKPPVRARWSTHEVRTLIEMYGKSGISKDKIENTRHKHDRYVQLAKDVNEAVGSSYSVDQVKEKLRALQSDYRRVCAEMEKTGGEAVPEAERDWFKAMQEAKELAGEMMVQRPLLESPLVQRRQRSHEASPSTQPSSSSSQPTSSLPTVTVPAASSSSPLFFPARQESSLCSSDDESVDDDSISSSSTSGKKRKKKEVKEKPKRQKRLTPFEALLQQKERDREAKEKARERMEQERARARDVKTREFQLMLQALTARPAEHQTGVSPSFISPSPSSFSLPVPPLPSQSPAQLHQQSSMQSFSSSSSSIPYPPFSSSSSSADVLLPPKSSGSLLASHMSSLKVNTEKRADLSNAYQPSAHHQEKEDQEHW